uniref:Ubiquitin conjugating enzyme E2 K n=1 Tax=Molossus molossus TaxID=27622 RepID=A0A7J8K2N4_MOLMO|nr:ubiquitin conjugating enzyme E2 K [Molossus molossus]
MRTEIKTETSKNQIKVDLVDENFTELRGEIAGPPDTPYEGGRYQLEIKIPETYPFNPPKVEWEGERGRERKKYRRERDTSSGCHPHDQPGLGTNCNRGTCP